MRSSRLLSILILLQLRVRLTAEALAEEFEVSVRTIYRDIDALSAAGIPVYGDRGPGGGFQLLDGYRTRLTGLASDEAEAMLMIGMPGPAAALGLGAAANRAKGKLLAALTPQGSIDADRISGRFHLDPVDWYRAAEPARHLPALARAILDQLSIMMCYNSWAGIRDRVVDPLGLVLKSGSWYIVGSISGDIRTYKVANVITLTVQRDKFERPPNFDLASHWANQIARFELELRPEIATILASPIGLKRLSALGAYAARAVSEANPADPQGWSELKLPFENIEQAALALLGIGPEIKAIAPIKLRQRIQCLAREILSLTADRRALSTKGGKQAKDRLGGAARKG
jgi:predicted DNA-binding transcriptional regulator YafY